ncbi:MAG: alpha/beta hydrolase [Anaerolineales bacterium]
MVEPIHQNQPVISFGTDLDEAEVAVILLHGRGSSAQAMIPLAQELQREGINFHIPQSTLNRWYPNSDFGSIESNEPDLSSALDTVNLLVKELQDHGFTLDQIVIGGFSQGACLASEYVVRNPGRYGGLFVFSGALIGPAEMVRNDQGSSWMLSYPC